MAISVVTLKTGERVITDLKEIFDGDDENKKGVCLLMEDPYILEMVGDRPQYITEQYQMEYSVKFSKWNPYSSDWQFKIPYDCIMTISDPEPQLLASYSDKVEKVKELNNDRTDRTED